MARAPSPERLAKAAIRDQLRAFRKKFGRDPGPDDPVFFDPDAPGDQPVPISEEALRDGTLAAMKQAGTPPEIVQSTPVPAQVMHSSTRRRLTPEPSPRVWSLWS